MASRRIAALLVAWLALAASAAPACAAVLQDECCPAEACCVDAVPGQALPSAMARVGQDLRTDSHSPDALIDAAWTAVAALAVPAPVDRWGRSLADDGDGRSVYLRTGRLRL